MLPQGGALLVPVSLVLVVLATCAGGGGGGDAGEGLRMGRCRRAGGSCGACPKSQRGLWGPKGQGALWGRTGGRGGALVVGRAEGVLGQGTAGAMFGRGQNASPLPLRARQMVHRNVLAERRGGGKSPAWTPPPPRSCGTRMSNANRLPSRHEAARRQPSEQKAPQ